MQLKEMREKARARYTVKALADCIGVSVPTYYRLEEHPGQMTIEQMRKLADWYGCPMEDLFYLPGNLN